MELRKYFGLCIFLVAVKAFPQANCETPLPPVLTSVSVQPENGTVHLAWIASPSTDIAAYIIYTYDEDFNAWMPIRDTIWNPGARSYSFQTSATRYKSIKFVIAAYRSPLIPGRPGCPSELSNSLETIFCHAQIDTCAAKINVSWNRYSGGKNVIRYDILVSEDNSTFTPQYTAAADAENFVVSNFNTGRDYCFAVLALLDDGSSSGSNKSCFYTSISSPPQWISADYVSVNDEGDIDLGFSIDPSTGYSTYDIIKNSESIATVKMIAGKIIYTDDKADITKVNLYSVAAINNCGTSSVGSDIYSNIHLKLVEVADEYRLSWNDVRLNNPGSYSYEVYYDSGNGFKMLAATDTVKHYSVKPESIMYEVTGSEVCFLIKAREINNEHGNPGENISSVACSTSPENIIVPNVFTPNGDLINDHFNPVLSFTPSEYRLVISDRQGRIMFETTDFARQWDGSGAEQGVYLWYLRLTSPSGKVLTRKGTITIIR